MFMGGGLKVSGLIVAAKVGFFKQPWLFGLARPDLCADLQEYLARTLTKKQVAE